MELRTIEWKNNRIKIIDQRKLPGKLEYLYISNLKELYQAIKFMAVRGAPALGAAAGLGVYLGIKDSQAGNFSTFSKELDKAAGYLASCRPTARNLFWGIERACSIALRYKDKPVSVIKKMVFEEAQNIVEEDRASCRKIALFGARLIKDNDAVLTICNAGILATIDFGTALGVFYQAKAEGKNIKVFACETRPALQGARLTAWELQRQGINCVLICDSMAALLMRRGEIRKVIAGADRIAANGDTANKIGTYNLAVLSRFHKIPFYIAAPISTFDLTIKNGQGIPIEMRDPLEVTTLFFKKPIAPGGIEVFNPAFDVTPNELITAIITDKGIIRPPYAIAIRDLFSNCNVGN